jgi:hypothetical protein
MYSGEYDVFDVTVIFFKLARCGYTHSRETSQTSYSPEYITPTQKKS